MYLTEAQATQILNSNFFQVPMTLNKKKYSLYRGRRNATVHTLRFNCIEGFNELFVRENVLDYLGEHFSLETQLLGSISYDFLLVNSAENPKSYYIWRSNSNAVYFSAHVEAYFTFEHINVVNFVSSIFNIDPASLNINFENSNCTIERTLAVVLTFTKE
jgi:hypothetical protein